MSEAVYILGLWINAYQRENKRLKQDIEFLNASLDIEHEERMKWEALARKNDKLRVEESHGYRRKSDC